MEDCKIEEGMRETKVISFLKIHAQRLLTGYLCICCGIGLFYKLIIAVFQPLTSDTVLPGIIAMEIWRHQNGFLHDMVLPAPDPNIIEDICFFLVPQILSNFNPLFLKLSGYVIFLCIILIFSLILYTHLKNKIAILFFVALMGSSCPSQTIRDSTYYYASKYLLPVFHNSTVLFFGILVFLIFSKKWDTFPRIIIPISILALVTFSDSLLVIWFVVPLVAMYFCSWNTKFQPRTLLVGICFLISIVTHFIKYFNPMLYEYADFSFKLLSRTETDFSKFTLLFQTYLVPDFLYSTLIPGVMIIAVIMAILLGLAILVKRSTLQDEDKGLVIFSISSIICTMIIIILFSEMDAWPYISQIPILLYIIIILLIFKLKVQLRYILMLLLILITINLIMLTGLILTIPTTPNDNQYSLIQTMEENGITHAFSNFWDANLITYLSNERVKVRAVEYVGVLTPFIDLSNIQWFENQKLSEKPLTLIVRSDDTENFYSFVASNPPDRFNDLQFYSVLQYDSLNSTSIKEVPKNWREKLGTVNIGFSRILEKFHLLTTS